MMQIFWKNAWCAAALGIVGSLNVAVAQPVVFDTASAHVIVIRPVDIWSGDESNMKDSLNAVTDKKVAYSIVVDGKYLRGAPTTFQSVSDNPITVGVKGQLDSMGVDLAWRSRYSLRISDSTALSSAQYDSFAAVQAEYFEKFVVSQGNPRDLASHIGLRHALGNVLAVGSMFIPVHGMGLGSSAQVIMNSGIANDIGNIPAPARALLTPAVLPKFDSNDYKEIDIRHVDYNPLSPGEIIIAYKNDKTPEAENTALVKAIVSITASDETPAQVEAARTADYDQRVTMWDACISDEKCQKEASK